MAEYKLIVNVDNCLLSNNEYNKSYNKLVIARKVNGSLNMVFQGHEIASTIEFKWAEKFKVFLVANLTLGAPLIPHSNQVEIEAGQLTKLTANGIELEDPATQQQSGFCEKLGSFGIGDAPPTMYAGVSMAIDKDHWSPIWVDRLDKHHKLRSLQPQEWYVMWKKQIWQGVILKLEESHREKIVFEDGETTKTIRYGFNKPDAPDGAEFPTWHYDYDYVE